MDICDDLRELRPALATCEMLSNAVGTINPQLPGLHNALIRYRDKLVRRLLAEDTRRLQEFNSSVVRSLDVLAGAIDNLQTNQQTIGDRSRQLDRDNKAVLSCLQQCVEFLAKLKSPADSKKNVGAGFAVANIDGDASKPQVIASASPYDFDELRSALASMEMSGNAIGSVNPRSFAFGWYNELIQLVKKLIARPVARYTQALREFSLSVVRPLKILTTSIEQLQTKLQAIDERLLQLEGDNMEFASSLQKCLGLSAKVKLQAGTQKNVDLETAIASMEGDVSKPLAAPCVWRHDFDELNSAVVAVETNATRVVNPRPCGWFDNVLQPLKNRSLAWYMQPLHDFNSCVSRSLKEIVCAIGNLSMIMAALDERLTRAEKRSAVLAEAMQHQLGLLHEQVMALTSLRNTATLESGAGRMETDSAKRLRELSRFYLDAGLGKDRTTYVMGLFGSGRLYINMLMMQNIGERARYFRDGIQLPQGPTSMIYSGHATMRHISRGQSPPSIMKRILQAVKSGFADLIFVYRHPLDSLLTNWIYWRTYARDKRAIWGVSQVYKNTDDLCAELEQNFSEFTAFAKGDPEFFAANAGKRFLSFQEFVEETELQLEAATLTLRLEDFMTDPFKEFCKIVEVMSVDPKLIHLPVAPPTTKPYRYLAVKEKAPQFRRFIDGLEAQTKRQIEKMGYSLS